MQTEFDFTLPLGYVDQDGNIHKEGTMRLATAMDEIAPLRDPRVRANQAYLVIILLSRVIVKLGTFSNSQITTHIIENLFAPDLAYLQAFYRQIHEEGVTILKVKTAGGEEVEIDLASLGVVGYPLDRLRKEVAYIAYHFHWPYDQVMQFEHTERIAWVKEIADINRRLTPGPASGPVLQSSAD